MDRLIDWIERFQKRTFYKSLFLIVAIALFCSLSFQLFGPNLKADWWIIDDHEIITLIGSDQTFALQEVIPTLLTRTELSPDSNVARFRPVYYFFRLLETHFWLQGAPMGWYLTRILIFAFFLIILALFFTEIHGPILGILLGLFCTTYAFWVDIFARLGPSEAYAVMGAAIFLLGWLLSIKKRNGWLIWGSITTGMLISTGSKENMAILLLPFLYLFQDCLRTRPRQRTAAWISFGVSMAWLGWIMVNILLRIGRTNTDIYNNSASLTDRLAVVFQYISGNLFLILLLLGMAAFGGALYLISKNPDMRGTGGVLFWGGLFNLALVLSQVFFYNDAFEGRYLFPMFLFLPFTISLFIYLFQKYALYRKNKALFHLLNVFFIIGLAISVNPAKWQFIREQSMQNVRRTHDFMRIIDELEILLDQHPDTDLVFYGTNPGLDYEPIDSYEQFLRVRNVNNKFFILRDPPVDYETEFTPFGANLEKILGEKSINGDAAWTISPLAELNNDPDRCVLVTLFQDHAAPIQCATTIDGNVFLND